MKSHLTVRGLPPDVARGIDRERKLRGTSINRTVIDLLRRALGLLADHPYDNGLGRHAGTWSAEDLRQFEEATRCFERVDPDLWR